MIILCSVVLCFLNGVSCYEFPSEFVFGAASSAYQVEGGWNVSDKFTNIWQYMERTHPEKFPKNTTAAIACDSYHQWKRDIEMISELGLDFYRFSISWARLLPSGFSNHISEDGTRFYNNLIDELLKKNIQPMVTLYHFDLPQSLQDLGGWTNPLVAEWFGDYARVVFNLFGDRVKIWLTINEPLIFCELSYGLGIHAPGISSPGIGNYLCSKHALLAHATAWRIYDEEFRHLYHGKVSLANQLMWFEAVKGDEESAELTNQYGTGLFSHPIYSKEGGWPEAIEIIIEKKSKVEGYLYSRLPAFTKKEKEFVKGTFDFYGLNYYTSRLAQKSKNGHSVGVWPFTGVPDLGIELSPSSDWPSTNYWLYLYPSGLRKYLSWVKRNYGDIEIIITENGCSSPSTGLHDEERVQYYKLHLEQVLLAIHEDNVNVTGFTGWTLMDNYEWSDGYQGSYGFYAVDFTDPQRKRTPRSSAYFYAEVIKSRSLNVSGDYTPYANAVYSPVPIISSPVTSAGLVVVVVISILILLIIYYYKKTHS